MCQDVVWQISEHLRENLQATAETKKMAQQLQLLFAHPKDPDLTFSTNVITQKHHLLQFQGMQYISSSDLHKTPGTHVLYIHTCRPNIHSHKIKEEKKRAWGPCI
jgi:hypothetical protein